MEKANSFKLVLVGDIMLGRLVNEHLKTVPQNYPWGDTLPILEQADVRICNLECVVSDQGRPWSATPKVFHFRSDAKNVEVLKTAQIDGVSLANNHALDYEYEAMDEMIKLLDKAKIVHAGAGKDQYAASMPAIIQKGRTSVGLISFTDNEPGWQARKNRPGVFYVPVDINDRRAQVLFELVKKIKQRVHFLVVAAHWGGNWGYEPPAEHLSFARALIDRGADIIFGHSAHVFRGIEIYRGRPVIYSAGDFIDDYAVDEIERNDESFIFILEIEDGLPKQLRLHPTIIDNFQAKLAGSRSPTIAHKMQKLCEAFAAQSVWHERQEFLEIPIS